MTERISDVMFDAMEADERKRLAESLKAAGTNLDALVVRLEKGGQ